MTTYVIKRDSDELMHFGIKGQKWGVRRYENEDGTLTEAGKIRYAKAEEIAAREKISGKQMAKNAIRRGMIGGSVGTAIGGIKTHVDTVNSLNKNFDKSFTAIPKDLNDAMDEGKYTFPGQQRFTAKYSFDIPGSKKFYESYAQLPQMNMSTPEGISSVAKFTSTLLNGPSSIIGGTLIGGGAGALGSVAVDSIHNLKIDRAKNFIKQYKSAYDKTYNKQ